MNRSVNGVRKRDIDANRIRKLVSKADKKNIQVDIFIGVEANEPERNSNSCSSTEEKII